MGCANQGLLFISRATDCPTLNSHGAVAASVVKTYQKFILRVEEYSYDVTSYF
jgi:hypothetical protein